MASDLKANAERGEVPLVVVRDGQTLELVLFLSMTASMLLQKRRQKTLGALIEDTDKFDVEAIRDVLFMLLQKHHAADFKTTEAVNNLIDEVGGPMRAYRKIVEVLKLNAPEGDANPTTAPNPIGAEPSSTLAG